MAWRMGVDVAAEIFVRLPPDEPVHLIRASVVCKLWLRVITDPDFLRRYRAFHRTPPLLGLLHRLRVVEGDPDPRLVTTTAVPLLPYPDLRRSRALDCRHGRVLLHVLDASNDLLVWDPVTGDQQRLPCVDIPWLTYSAAVLCAAGGCDHLDCHGQPFLVILVCTHYNEDTILACVYSSETGAWTEQASLEINSLSGTREDRPYLTPYVQPRRGALIGDGFFFTVRESNEIIKYDWGKNCLSPVKPLPPDAHTTRVALMVMDNTALGFAYILDSVLHLWSTNVNSQGAADWGLSRVIKLEAIVPGGKACVVGSAEGVGVIFVSTDVGLFTIELKSTRVRKVQKDGLYFSVLPYMSFYTTGVCEDVLKHLLESTEDPPRASPKLAMCGKRKRTASQDEG